MTEFVLDASVALAWIVDHPVPAYALRVAEIMEAGNKAKVPGLWVLEMANGLLMAARRKRLTFADAEHGLRQLEVVVAGGGIEVDAVAVPTIREAFTGGEAYGLTAYDAVYLELARREGLALATLDQRLRAAAVKAGLPAIA